MDQVPSQLGVFDVDQDVAPKIKKPRAPNFDAKRLMDPNTGLVKLRSTIEKTKFKHKTRKDLTKLVGIYGIWCHNIWPKCNQRDLLELIAKAGDSSEIRAFRKDMVTQEKYAGVATEPELVEPAEPDEPEPTHIDSREKHSDRDQSDPEPLRSALRSAPSNALESDSDIELDIQPAPAPLPTAAAPAADASADSDSDEQWRIYRELGF